MLVVIADTHAVIWYLDNEPRLSVQADAFMEATATDGNTIGIATITFVEMVYLSERGRISTFSLPKLYASLDQPNPLFIELPLDRSIAHALATIDRQAIPDMPDRIIAATAMQNGIPLINRDSKIQLSTVPTIW